MVPRESVINCRKTEKKMWLQKLYQISCFFIVVVVVVDIARDKSRQNKLYVMLTRKYVVLNVRLFADGVMK